MSWERVLDWARNKSPLRSSHIHGEEHWRGVATMGLLLAKNTPEIDKKVILCFSVIHDSRREDECFDEGHGARAAECAREASGVFDFLTKEQLDQVLTACRIHTHAKNARGETPSVMACLDADRFNLLRLGFNLDRERFSLPYREN